LINLGFADMQAWDEGLYAVRTVGLLTFGAWLDQSSVSIWGIYSSLHPPLYIWLSAPFVEFIGNTEFAHRVVSTLFGAFTVPILYWIGLRLSSDEREGMAIGFIGALLFALNPFIDFYARQGQFDTTLLFFMALSVLCIIRGVERNSLTWSVGAGIAIGLGLMTKLFVAAGIPLAFAIWIVVARRHRDGRIWLQLGIACTIAMVIAAPWHAMMVIRHGEGNPLFLVTQSQMLERFVTGIEGNTKSLELFYYVNQLFVLFPLGVAWSLFGLVRALRQRGTAEYLLCIWFLLYFAIFTVMRTKLEFYALPMLASLALLGGRELVRAMRGELSTKLLGVLTGATAIAVAWSAQQEWRTEIKRIGSFVLAQGGSAGDGVVGGWILSGLLVAGVILGCLVWLKGIPRALLTRLAVVMFVPALALSLYNHFIADTRRWDDGGSTVARFINDGRFSQLLAIGYETNPQLTWYLDGVDVGWRSDMSLLRIDPTGHADHVKNWIGDTLRSIPADVLVIVERDRLVRGTTFTTEEVRPTGWATVMTTRRYSLLVRSRSDEHTPPPR